ncbi:hypothetical protein ACQPXB_12460 [Amycolatopsis sp. CA-161197]|uniref:hypothetical protein n=1 Tax=Amycolatopsis sp. CA-161197 TaxID=3239922 RepID=UPI003D8FBA1E
MLSGMFGRNRFSGGGAFLVYLWMFGVPIFVVLLIVGIIGDRRDWWSGWPYSTNMLTAATGAAIGIPFAVSVVNRLGKAQSDAQQWNSTWRYALQVTASLRKNSGSMETRDGCDSEIVYMRRRAISIGRGIIALNQKMVQITGPKSYPAVVGPGTELALQGYNLMKESLQVAVDELKELRTLVLSLFNGRIEAKSKSLQAYSDWQTIDTVIRPRIAEQVGSWVPIDAYVNLTEGRPRYSPAEIFVADIDRLISLIENGQMVAPYGLPDERLFDGLIDEIGKTMTMRNSVTLLELTINTLQQRNSLRR